MKTLVIYDNEGKIYTTITGNYQIPIGIQYLEVIIPSNKELVGVDVSVKPHAPIFEDVSKTETELLKEEILNLKQTNVDLTVANELLAESLIEFKMQYTSVPCQLHQEYPAIVDGLIEGAKTDGTV